MGVTAHGMSIVFNTDFRAWLKYQYAQELKNAGIIEAYECNSIVSQVCFIELNKEALHDEEKFLLLMNAAAWFYSCGDMERVSNIKITERMQSVIDSDTSKPEISFYWDFLHLWAAFKHVYGIDLYKIKSLHWWVFQAHFINLPHNNSLASLRQLRGMTRDEYAGKPGKSDWGKVVLQQRLKAIPEYSL